MSCWKHSLHKGHLSVGERNMKCKSQHQCIYILRTYYTLCHTHILTTAAHNLSTLAVGWHARLLVCLPDAVPCCECITMAHCGQDAAAAMLGARSSSAAALPTLHWSPYSEQPSQASVQQDQCQWTYQRPHTQPARQTCASDHPTQVLTVPTLQFELSCHEHNKSTPVFAHMQTRTGGLLVRSCKQGVTMASETA